MVFPCGSVGEESACNVEDPGLIPRLGTSGEGNDNPLQFYWASQVTQMVKFLHAMLETRV